MANQAHAVSAAHLDHKASLANPDLKAHEERLADRANRAPWARQDSKAPLDNLDPVETLGLAAFPVKMVLAAYQANLGNQDAQVTMANPAPLDWMV